MNDSIPSPDDASSQPLPADLVRLARRMARNIHDAWAEERRVQGWRLGPRRDDSRKEHPGLVPYDELPESEKVFDLRTAEAALVSLLDLGCRIESPAAPLAPNLPQAVTRWIESLEAAWAASVGTDPRAATFDMDDDPELANVPHADVPVAAAALRSLQEIVYPVWKTEDQTALEKQARHRTIAKFAIWPGVAAVLCAVLQLTWHHFDQAPPVVAEALLWFEIVAVLVSAAAVVIGLATNMHHGWLAHRQRAERIRSLKFASLSWPELWDDLDRWRQRLRSELDRLSRVTTDGAHHWAREEDAVDPGLPPMRKGQVGDADLALLRALYRVKRLCYQHRYFTMQSVKAGRRSWIGDCKVGLVLFFLSVVAVLVHVLHHFIAGAPTEHGVAPHGLGVFDLVTISLAALLPVVGFGLRAWLAAFEAPRSRNLYNAKALALEDYIKRSDAVASDAVPMMRHIALGEHFFLNEHREWCRLQMEAEWFV